MSEIRITHNRFDPDKIQGKTTLQIAMEITSEVKTRLTTHVRTGRLRNSYMWKVNDAGDKKKGGLNNMGGAIQPAELTIEAESGGGVVGSNCEYALYAEMGTRYMAPIPALRPAIAIVTTNQSFEQIAKKVALEVERGKLFEGRQITNFFEVKS
jgi:hypothetical protein